MDPGQESTPKSDRQAGRQTDRQTERRTNRQTDRHGLKLPFASERTDIRLPPPEMQKKSTSSPVFPGGYRNQSWWQLLRTDILRVFVPQEPCVGQGAVDAPIEGTPEEQLSQPG